MTTLAAVEREVRVAGARRIRPPVAVLLSRFPLITETFILREVIELEQQGQPVRLVPLIREEPHVVHREARPWLRRALYTPFLSPAILAANLRALRRRPGRYVRLLSRSLWGSRSSWNLLLGTLGIFPKSVYLAEQLARENIAHVHAHYATHPAMAAWIISALSGIPFSITAHAHDIFVHRAMLETKLRDAAFVRVISRFNRDYLTRLYLAIPQDKLKVVRVGVRVDDFTPAEPPACDSTLRILCVAGFKPYKGLSVLIEACRSLHRDSFDFVCDLVGDGPLREGVERQIVAQGLQSAVRLRGPLPQHEVARLMRACSVFVLPSVVARDGQMEGIPVVLMEAMAAERPVVASRLSGIPELVEHGRNGLLVDPGDAAALVAALRRLGQDPKLGRRLGRAARATISERYRLERSVAELLALLDGNGESRVPLDEQRIVASGWPGFDDSCIGVRRVDERRDSWIAELLASQGGASREVVVKSHRTRQGEPLPAEARARHEYRVLSSVQERLRPFEEPGGNCPRLGVPRVLHFDPRTATLILERCPGEPLDRLLRAFRRCRGSDGIVPVGRILYGCGRWLRELQNASAASGGTEERLDTLFRRIDASADARTRAATAALRPALAPSSRRTCGTHGDFWPGNVFVSDSSIEVIDFEGYRPGLPFEDVGNFLLHLSLFFCYPFALRRGRALAGAFLDGYRRGEPLDPAALRLGWIHACLAWLARPRTGRKPVHSWQAAVVRRWVRARRVP